MSVKGQSHEGKVKYAAVLRPIHKERVCGDGYFFIPSAESVLFGLVDGLGHGPGAHEAATKATARFSANSELPLDQLVMKSHQEIKNTRGCVAFIAKLVIAEKKLQCVSIGNIGAKFISKHRNLPVSLPGVLGANLRRVEVTTLPVESGDTIALYSDGVSSRFKLEELVENGDLLDSANRIIADYGYSHDDSSVIIVRMQIA